MPTSKTIKELLANGAHFGHPTNKWNPKMEKFIFGEKSGIYIIDLEKSEKALQKAQEFVKDLAKNNKTVLFAGTKRQSKKIVREEAERCGMFYVDERWLGGCLTNFSTIRKSVDKLDEIQEMKEGKIYDSLAKKEQAQIDREENKLLRNLGGIRKMKKLPDCVVVVDTVDEEIAVKEARKKEIPIVAIVDTNSDPDNIDFPVPANDDAIRSIRYIVSTLADAVIEGGGGILEMKPLKKEETSSGEEEKKEEKREGSVEEAPSSAEENDEVSEEAEVSEVDEELDEVKQKEKKETDAEEDISEEKEEQEEKEKIEEKKQDPSEGTEVAEGDIKLDE